MKKKIYKNSYYPYKNLFRPTSIIVWIFFALVLVLGFYSIWYLPHGPIYDTGKQVCPLTSLCGEQFAENMSNLHIPGWAKFLREDGGMILLFVLGGLGIYLSTKAHQEEEFLRLNPQYRKDHLKEKD